MGFYIYLFGPIVVSSVLGIAFGVIYRRKADRNYKAAQLGLAKLMQDQRPTDASVVRLFEDHEHRLIESNGRELVFSPRPFETWSTAALLGWSLILCGGPIIFVGLMYLTGRPDQRVIVDLAALLANG
ncbi:hypothetical protein RJ527_12070 [Thalassospiraceae bacterium LMO-SO8]|nr:hypothetical protein [Alphaproteobacteria bacterium LMO-S08]WND74777.1 hypothetical protein RJ527_12070 [Thalassospiraceae bacterium LMO-SO8]